MGLEILQEYMIPFILAFCFIVAEIIKKVDKEERIVDYLSLILPLLGIVLAIWIEGFILTPDTLLRGLASGWASTGAWESIKATISK